MTHLVVTVAFALAAPAADPAKEALDALQGEWKIVESVKKGTADEPKEFADRKVTIKDDKLKVVRAGSKREEAFVLALDPKTDPKAIDVSETGEKEILKGIYKLDKDRLTICVSADPDGARPKEFKSTEKPNVTLLVMERVKK